MKKLIIIIVAAVIACAGVVALMETNSAGAGLRLTTYKCYKARHAKRSPRFQPERVFVTDQFRHNVEVSVLKLNTHCSQAEQELFYDGTAAGFDTGLNCYGIRDVPRQERFEPQNIEVRDKLTNWNDQTLTVSRVQSLCTQSQKSKFKGTLEGDSFVCYQAKTAKGEPRFQQRDMAIADNYDPSGKEVRVIRPVAYCSRSEKKVDARNDDFNSLYNAGDITDEDLSIDEHASTVHSTLESNDPIVSCKTDYSNSVWYHWNSDLNLSLMIDTSGSSYDTVVAVFTGDKGDLDEIGCNDDVDVCELLFAGGAGCCASGDAAGCCPVIMAGVAGDECEGPTTSFLQFDATANTAYHILVASSEGRGGKLKFRVSAKSEDQNADSCSTPRLINSLDFDDHISTMNATFAEGAAAGTACSPGSDPDLSCTGPYGATVWYTYTPPSHRKVQFDTFGTSYPTVIAVFDFVSPTELACDSSSVNVVLKAGHKYLILVGSTDSDDNNRGGKLKFHATLIDELSAGSAGVTDQGTPDSLTCYQVRQPRHSNETENIVDQFSLRQVAAKGPGFWTLIIGGVDSVCVPSNKTTCTNQYVTGDGEAAELCQKTCGTSAGPAALAPEDGEAAEIC